MFFVNVNTIKLILNTILLYLILNTGKCYRKCYGKCYLKYFDRQFLLVKVAKLVIVTRDSITRIL